MLPATRFAVTGESHGCIIGKHLVEQFFKFLLLFRIAKAFNVEVILVCDLLKIAVQIAD